MGRRERRGLASRIRHGDAEAVAMANVAAELMRRVDDVEYLELLEYENAELSRLRREFEERILPAMGRLPQSLRYEQQIDYLETRVRELEAARFDVEELPQTLGEVVDMIGRMYPDTIEFSEDARASADRAQLNQVHDGPAIAWRMLRCMATTLHELYGASSGDIAATFRDRSGFELASTESAATSNSRDLCRRRRVIRGGTVLDASAHVKYGTRPPRILRVHFAVCARSRRIIVAHCGDHLPTAGMRRRRR